MLKVGLTGGIGAGKSIVAKVFEVLGIPVYQADDAAKKLMETNKELMDLIKINFSENAYVEGKLNRKFLADIVFNDKEKLKVLNSLVHPFTIQDGIDWMNKQDAPYAIKEAALIFESGSQHAFDVIIGVFAPQAMRVNRTLKRDQTTRELVLERMENQLDDSLKMKLCNEILINDEQKLLLPQIVSLHLKLIQMSFLKSFNV
jgi:dephospho-CoA kinase